MSEARFISYSPPGPISTRFMHSDALVRGLMGPYASGKTSCGLMDLVRRAGMQARSPVDGVRRTKWAIVRDTYRNLEKTTIPSWLEWVPKDMGEFTGGDGGRPAKHVVPLGMPDGSRVEAIFEFFGLGENRVEDVMRGWEGTGALLDEADRLGRDILTFVLGRIAGGRYPSMTHGGPTWQGVTCIFNAPDTENWTYGDFVKNKLAGFEFFRMPSGFSSRAENLKNLKPGFYERMAIGQPDWWVRRYIENRWGYSREGLPVYPDFNDDFHVAGYPLKPIPNRPVLVGFDAGLSPAGILFQVAADGQFRILEEIVGTNIGATRFSEEVVRVQSARYGDWDLEGWADPASMSRASTDERSWLDVVAANTKLTIKPAPTNALIPRIDAVRNPLVRLIDGARPGLLLDQGCTVLREGFNSGYHFKRVRIGSGDRFEEVPAKNEFSHPHDGLQYGALGAGEYQRMLNQGRRGGKGGFGRSIEYPAAGVA